MYVERGAKAVVAETEKRLYRENSEVFLHSMLRIAWEKTQAAAQQGAIDYEREKSHSLLTFDTPRHFYLTC